jgi:hypothetical protein
MNLMQTGSSIVLTVEELEQLEKLAGANYSIEDLAVFFNRDKKLFTEAFNAPDSELKFHYNRGQLIVQAEINIKLYDSAKEGNITASQQLQKAAAHNKLENAKKRATLNLVHQKYEQLQEFIRKKHKGELPPDLAMHYEQLDFVRAMWYKRETKEFIINALLSSYPEMTFYRAKQCYEQSINFFYLDSEIQISAWANAYADFMDQMAAICFEMADFEEARLLTRDAFIFRKDAENFKPKDDKDNRKIIVIYTSDTSMQGLPKANRAKLKSHIDSLPDISDADRNRLHFEAKDGVGNGNILNTEIPEIPYLEINEDESDKD